MLVYRSYKYRLYPNKTQQVLINKTMGCVRFYWNQQVATFMTYDKETNPKPEFKTNGMTVIKQVPKYELVTSHTARRSFATNLYRRGLPASQIMLLTGHKTEGAFLRYIKVSKEDNARDVLRKLKIS